MNRKGDVFLATCLLDSLKDESYTNTKNLLFEHHANPNVIIPEHNIAPIHYAAGMENEDFADAAMKLMLKCKGDPNVQTIDGETPLHIAVIWSRTLIVEMLLDHGANINIEDVDGNTAINHAITEKHYHLITLFKKLIYEQKKLNKAKAYEGNVNTAHRNKINATNDIALITNKMRLLSVPSPGKDALTPNKTNFNYQSASPYYVNIKCTKGLSKAFDEVEKNPTKQNQAAPNAATERQHKIQSNLKKAKCSRTISVDNEIDEIIVISSDSDEAPEPDVIKTNLFELTEENLGKHLTLCPKENADSLINIWRDKLHKTRARESILPKDSAQLNTFISEHMTESTSSPSEQTVIAVPVQATPLISPQSNDSFVTADENGVDYILDEKTLALNSDNIANDEMIIAQEKYEHFDVENNIVIYETRTIANQSMQNIDQNSSSETGTQTTESALPSDYDTDNLRQELRHFGDKPGPITKNTKRLYLKRLVRYKKRPQLIEQNERNRRITRKYSVELQKTLQDDCDRVQAMGRYSPLERQMSISIAQTASVRCREGNLKMSFIYLLIDPRISENLPAESQMSSKQDIWCKFVSSIFYVGKGKSSRPYAHFYDAIKLFDDDIRGNSTMKYQESVKLDRIIEIWRANKGVICLPIFHNITPSEAYTREASIIDCLGVENLTNIKRGDYYGISKSWSMKDKRKLGVYLLHKAMNIFLVEGESQLRPNDLKK